MNTETVNDVLREMRDASPLHTAQDLCPEFADRIERALAGSEPVAEITGIDEFGPMLAWRKHWVDVGAGARLYTAPHPALANPQTVVDLSRFREAVECFADCNTLNAEKSRRADELLALIPTDHADQE